MVNFTTVACRISSRLKWYKNYKNRLRLAKVIVKNKMSRFIMVHCVHLFNGLFSRTTWVSQHLKGKPFWILLEGEMMGWQWHQLDHMQIICTLLQPDNYASTSPLSFYRLDTLPDAQPTVSKCWRKAIMWKCMDKSPKTLTDETNVLKFMKNHGFHRISWMCEFFTEDDQFHGYE